MGDEPTSLEERLRADLSECELLRDESFARELYRALTNRVWRSADRPDGVALSWTRAEELVNELRETVDEEPLRLAQTGGEGELGERAADELGRRGWTSEPLDTGARDERHAASAASPPPGDAGEAQAPTEPPAAWRGAHDEAAENARRR
jgi:hypothetical protein